MFSLYKLKGDADIARGIEMLVHRFVQEPDGSLNSRIARKFSMENIDYHRCGLKRNFNADASCLFSIKRVPLPHFRTTSYRFIYIHIVFMF
jgi:hypothetical protein